MKKLFSVFAVVMLAVMSLNLNAISVSAETPTTYYVKWDVAADDWLYQVGSKWDNESDARSHYYMTLEMKDGDYIVVESTSEAPALNLDFNLGNLTIMPNSHASVDAKSIKDCYVLSGAFATVDCNVTNGYLYDFSTANFNKDCTNLEISYSDETTVKAAVVGKCNDFYAHKDDNSKIKYHVYNFTDALVFTDGVLQNKASEYSANPSTAPAAPATPAAPAGSNSSEYDDVPKTGEATTYLWAFALAALCFAGSYSLKKRA